MTKHCRNTGVGGWVVGDCKNKANSAQLGSAGACAELNKMLIAPLDTLPKRDVIYRDKSTAFFEIFLYEI